MKFRRRKSLEQGPTREEIFKTVSETSRLKELRRTSDLNKIEEAVYSDNIKDNRYVASNPRLTERHCRELLPKMTDVFDRCLLVEVSAFPSDLLAFLASSDPSDSVRGIIANHPNASKETKVMATLRGTVAFPDFKFGKALI